jgi:hypothetical protein
MSGIQQMLTGGTYKPPIPYGWPANIGDAYGGGFFAGQINVSGTKYNLVVAPKSTGQASGKLWGTNGTTTGITSVINGPTNSAALAALGASYQAAIFCEGLTIGGFSDWYLPARNELEVLYYFLKPTTDANNTGFGSNANAVNPPEPVSTNYTSGNPAQTTSTVFKDGGSEAFSYSTDLTLYYWSSTEESNFGAWNKSFYEGYDNAFKDRTEYTRAIRRVLA